MSAPAFDELLRRLVLADVRFVLIGGLAVNAWGVVRGTKDVDIVPDPETENLSRIAKVAASVGGRVQTQTAFAGSAVSIAVLLSEGERVVIETELGPLDVVQGLPGVPAYARLLDAASEVELVGVRVPVCGLDDLLAMKRAAGRTRDIADLEDLANARDDP